MFYVCPPFPCRGAWLRSRIVSPRLRTMVRPADELPTESGSDAQATVPAKKGAVLAICTPLLSGSREMRIAVFACCIGAMAAVLLFSRALRDERGYTTARWLAVSTVLMIASCIGVYFIGVFS